MRPGFPWTDEGGSPLDPVPSAPKHPANQAREKGRGGRGTCHAANGIAGATGAGGMGEDDNGHEIEPALTSGGKPPDTPKTVAISASVGRAGGGVAA